MTIIVHATESKKIRGLIDSTCFWSSHFCGPNFHIGCSIYLMSWRCCLPRFVSIITYGCICVDFILLYHMRCFVNILFMERSGIFPLFTYKKRKDDRLTRGHKQISSDAHLRKYRRNLLLYVCSSATYNNFDHPNSSSQIRLRKSILCWKAKNVQTIIR